MAKTATKKTAARKLVKRSGVAKKTLARGGAGGAVKTAAGRPGAGAVARKAGVGAGAEKAAGGRGTGVAKKGGAARKTSRAVPAAAEPMDAERLAHGLNSLLHTMQAVQQYEESLCSLMHALRRGRATGAMVRELRAVLQQLPAQEYLHEVDALREAAAA